MLTPKNLRVHCGGGMVDISIECGKDLEHSKPSLELMTIFGKYVQNWKKIGWVNLGT